MRSNPMTVAMIAPAAYVAVEKVMRKFHESDPERFHAQRPSLRHCPFGDTQVGTRPPTSAEIRSRLRAESGPRFDEMDRRPMKALEEIPIIERCPHLKTM